MTRRRSAQAPDICPVCGEDVPRGSLACPECGADHNSGWREDTHAYDALDLPDENFDYDKFVRDEFGTTPKPVGIRIVWWIAAIVLVIVLAIACVYVVH
jgi:uncharacterized membrane protein YvbJ